MKIECSRCGAPAPKVLATVKCPCGAVGNYQQSRTDAEEFAGELRGLVMRAIKDGVSVGTVVENLLAFAREHGWRERGLDRVEDEDA